jgi:UrcA family protein
MKQIIFGTAAIAALACSAAVFASTDGLLAVREVPVHYSDLNVNSSQGAANLYARLRSAARTACGSEPGSSLRERADFSNCRADALSQAVADVNSRALTALHRTQISPLELARFDNAFTAR